MKIQILDANYKYDNERNPVIQLFGKEENGQNHLIRINKFKPYFYANLEEDADIDETKREIGNMGVNVTEIMKYEPIGFQTTKKKMLKIEAIDPKDVRTLRERVKNLVGIKEVYETDILFKNRFLIDKNLGGMKWAELSNKEEINESDIKSIEKVENAQLKMMSIDIECLPDHGQMPTPEKSPVILISFAFNQKFMESNDLVLVGKSLQFNENNTISLESEEELLSAMVEVIKEYDPDIVVGYNSNEFDLPYLEKRMQKLLVDSNIGKDGSNLYTKKIGIVTSVMIAGRIVVDLLPILRNSNEDKYKLKSYTLRNVAKKFLRIEKLDVEPKEMEQIWLNGSDEDLRRFIAYSRRDAIIALELLTTLKLMEKYVEMSKASGSLLQDIVNGGQSGMIENLLMRRFRKYDRVVSSKPDSELADERFENASELKGGAVLVPEKGLVEDVIILDYKSLYPTLMMAYNLCYSTVLNKENISNSEEIIKAPFGNGKFVPATIKKGIVPEILEELLNQRIEIKKKMKKSSGSERDLLDAKQYAIKILLNSFYGYSGYQRARLYDLRIANAVTSFGRENILKTQNVINSMNIEEKELHVCYGDTDSVFISVKSNKKLSIEKAKEIGNTISKEVTKNLPKPMELLYETFARRGILVAKKRYAMWIFDEDKDGYTDKLKIRGIETVRRDWCNLTSSTLRTILDLILKEGKVDEAISLANEKVQKIKNFNISTDTEMLEDLMLSRRYTKGINSYKNKQPHIQLVERMKNRGDVTPSIGDRIQYIIIKGKSGGRKGKKDLFVNRAEDPNYIKKYGIPIDTEYYINKQLLPPLLRIFEVLGGNKEIQEKIELKEKNQKTLEDWK